MEKRTCFYWKFSFWANVCCVMFYFNSKRENFLSFNIWFIISEFFFNSCSLQEITNGKDRITNFFTMIVLRFLSSKITNNVPALHKVTTFGTDYFLLKIKFLAKCKRVFTTKFAILPSIYVKAVTLSILKIIVILVTM